MKTATIFGTTLMALFLAMGNVMADETEGDSTEATGSEQLRTRSEANERVNMQDEGEQTRTQTRTRSEDGEAEGEQHQHKHSYQHKHQGATGSRTAGGSRR